jgi:hypothetical protein
MYFSVVLEFLGKGKARQNDRKTDDRKMKAANFAGYSMFLSTMASTTRCTVATVVLGLLGLPIFVRGQTSYPMLMSLSPVAAQIGQTTEHTLKSRYSMFGAFDVLVSGEGVTGEVVVPESKPGEQPNLQEVTVRFTVEATAEPGVRDFRLATPQGASTVGQLVVVRQPIVKEARDNDTRDKAQLIALPAALCGKIERNEDVDYYRFHAAAGQLLSFHVRSMRLQDRIHDLQSHVDPIVAIRNEQGTTLAANDNYFYGDPFVHHQFAQEGDYFLEIRDVRYQGNQYWEYCVEITDQPFVTNVFPLAVSRGQAAQLQFVGFSLPPQPAAILRIDEERPGGPGVCSFPMGSGASNPAPLVVSDLPVFVETNADNNSAAAAREVALPAMISGRIEAEADVDCFAFAALKGESFSFEVLARRQQSALDSNLRILDEKGSQLAVNDDLRAGKRSSADSWIESWTAPADGRYVVEIRDLHGRGGPQFVYAVQATRAAPGFRLWLDTDKTQLTPGTNGVAFVRAERKNGFTGEIQLQVAGVPHGVTASCGRILPSGQDGSIVFQADHDAPRIAANLTIRGIGFHELAGGETQLLEAVATPYQEIYQPGGGRGHWPVDMHTLCVGDRADIWSVQLSDYEVTLKPGESKQIEVLIDRAPGFDKNVTLDVTYNHLEQIHADSLPRGVKLDRGKSQTLLTGANSKGIITLTAAKDATPAVRQQGVVLANVSINFVMKATYCSPPLQITVVAP